MTAFVMVRVTLPMSRRAFSPSLRNEKLDRNTSPGQPWLTPPGFWVIDSELYGYGPNALEKKSMAWAAFSTTACALRAGEGCGEGMISMARVWGRMPGIRGTVKVSLLAIGKDFSTS